MYTKALTAAVAVLSFSSVEAAILPRATITPGTVVLPEVVFNPGELTDPLYTALKIVSTDLGKTTTLTGDLTRTVGTTVKDVSPIPPHTELLPELESHTHPFPFQRTDQVNAVIRQITSNTNSIRTRVGTVVGNLLGVVPSGIPAPSATSAAPPSIPTAEVVQIAQDVVVQAQLLARQATTQLQNIQAQANAVADPAAKAAYTLAYTQANLALQIALSTVGAAASTALTAVANAAGSANGLADRIRNIQAKLNPVLIIGASPDVTF
ncbi:hypothetical protein CPAR01_13630 [Colletotrichum paranaense]|uniref:Cell wall protein n=2 Tax=Colletotrichum acutatum species complex TaxID=2707335 RepID=A0AAI9UYS2_9PEZI|nr:uncharacterized protein CPAR01_13630 [Colletotrichum paranaense]KAK1467316.1 hypothetical protein CMEL01_11309 [Colletotrichum melonis]KAK1524682.1 hypothetical protein CPAR01_13630 [Colletotrichum paranaense]